MDKPDDISRNWLWLVPAQLVVHVLEEGTGFPEWATRHFAVLPRSLWLFVMFVVCTLLVLITWAAVHASEPRIFVFICYTFQMLFLCNAVFHPAATLWLADYSPGLISSVVLFVPVSLLLFRRKVRCRFLSRSDFSAALLSGFMFHVVLVLLLFVNKGP